MRKITVLLIAAWGGPALAVGLQLGHRPEIGAVEAPKTVKAGQAVKITVTAKNDGSSGCGLLVKWGDGTDQQMKMNRDEAKFPLTLEHTYKKNGRYTVNASGKEITTNKACKGTASAVVQVGPVQKASAKTK
jgi:PKD domain-containing protein